MSTGKPPPGEPVVIQAPAWVRPAAWVVGPPLGAGAGVAVGWLVSAAADAHWPLPLGRILRRAVRDVPDLVLQSGLVALGLAAGLVLAWCVVRDLVRVTVSSDVVRIVRAGGSHSVASGDVAYALVDGKELVLLAPDGSLLAAERTDFSPATLQDAFERAGLPWCERDPFDADFRRWVPGAYGLPRGAEPLLTARERALRDWSSDDAAEFARELARFGVVVRTRGRRQWWRLSGASPAAR